MQKVFSLIFFLTIFFNSKSQSVSGGGRSLNMRTYWASAKGYISPLGIDVNSEINKVYLSTSNGPYLNKNWFPGKVITIRGNVIDDTTIEYRFDLFQHSLHFRTVGEDKVQVLPAATYKGFSLYNGTDSLSFIKLLPPLTKVNPDVKFYEILVNSSKYRILKLYYSNLDAYTVAGPSNDGRKKYRFQDGVMYFLEKSSNEFILLKPKRKSIVEADKSLEKRLLLFEKNNGKIKNEESLVMFFNSL